VSPGDASFTASDVGINPANVKHLVDRGFIVPYVEPDPPEAPARIKTSELNKDPKEKSEGSVSLNVGSPWIFDPEEFSESSHTELLALIDTVCEERGLTPPKFRTKKPNTIKAAALKHLSQDRA